jgi:hypothetical protein
MTMQQYQRREVQDWLNLFEQQKQSGLTAVEFCRQQQINAQLTVPTNINPHWVATVMNTFRIFKFV